MKLLGNRVLISAVEKEVKEGFQTVDVQDSFVYKGKIEQLCVGYQGGDVTLEIGDVVLFAKGSPDTHEIDHEGKKYKSVLISDILAVL